MEPRLLALMAHTVTITPFHRYSTDGYNRPTYYTSQASTYRARVAFSRRLDPGPDGRSVTPVHVAWVASTAVIDVRSQFTFSGTTYRMVRAERVANDLTAHHNKLSFVGG